MADGGMGDRGFNTNNPGDCRSKSHHGTPSFSCCCCFLNFILEGKHSLLCSIWIYSLSLILCLLQITEVNPEQNQQQIFPPCTDTTKSPLQQLIWKTKTRIVPESDHPLLITQKAMPWFRCVAPSHYHQEMTAIQSSLDALGICPWAAKPSPGQNSHTYSWTSRARSTRGTLFTRSTLHKGGNEWSIQLDILPGKNKLKKNNNMEKSVQMNEVTTGLDLSRGI